MANETLMASLGLTIDPLQQSLKRAQNSVAEFGRKSFGELLSPIAKVTAAVGSVGAIMAGMHGALSLGAEMQDASNRTGIAVENMLGLRKAFKDAGVDAGALPGAINKMQRSLAGMGRGGGAATSLLKGMGLDPQQLASAKPDEAFRKIGEAINQLPNATARSAAAMALFGKSGGELLQVFASPAFQNAGNISNTAKLLGENSSSFKEAHEALSHVGTKLSGFFVGIASNFVPALSGVIDEFERLDFSGMGASLGNVLGNFVTDWKDETTKLMQFFADLLAIALSPDGIAAFVEALAIAASKFGEALIRAFKTPLDYLDAGLQYAIQKVLAVLANTPLLGKALGLENFQARSFSETLQGVRAEGNVFENQTKGNSEARAVLSSDLKERMAILGEQFSKAVAPVITATEATTKANEEGRAEAKAKYQRDLTGAAFDGSEIGLGKMSIISDSLARIGGGGNSTGLGNPILEENRRQTEIQQRIADYLGRMGSYATVSGAAQFAGITP